MSLLAGEGDTGDHWMVICDDNFWERDEGVMLKHVDTEVWVFKFYVMYVFCINLDIAIEKFLLYKD